MNHAEAMDALQAQGTEQNRKVYRSHGVTGESFGVSYAALGALKKAIRTDQALAESLWATGNHDARILATMIADPLRIDEATIDAWIHDVSNYPQTDAVASLAATSSHARTLVERWIAADSDWVSAAGWTTLARLVATDSTLDNEALEARLDEIERQIHTRPNRTRYAMNNVVIAIGLRNPVLRAKALAAAARIGKVDVDHGKTGCKTPDAAAYIEKALARKKA